MIFQRPPYKNVSQILSALWVCLFAVTGVSPAFAQGGGADSGAAADCLPGVPCIINLTGNDPDDDNDGPNRSGAPNAPKTDSATCDADFMNQIYARAILEADREVMINQTVIRKPDSVLEYTCFDQALRRTARIAGPIFTETQMFNGVTVPLTNGSVTLNVFLGSEKLDNSLDSVVTDSLNDYIDNNFAQEFLGGTAGLNNSIASSVSSAGSACVFMNTVFTLARCANFELDDQFSQFSDLIGMDLRNVSGGSNCTSPITQDLINVAGNEDFAHVNYDETDPFLDLISTSTSASNPVGCAPPILTGLIFDQDEFRYDSSGNTNRIREQNIRDAICPNPGCYYVPGGSPSSQGSCVRDPSAAPAPPTEAPI